MKGIFSSRFNNIDDELIWIKKIQKNSPDYFEHLCQVGRKIVELSYKGNVLELKKYVLMTRCQGKLIMIIILNYNRYLNLIINLTLTLTLMAILILMQTLTLTLTLTTN